MVVSTSASLLSQSQIHALEALELAFPSHPPLDSAGPDLNPSAAAPAFSHLKSNDLDPQISYVVAQNVCSMSTLQAPGSASPELKNQPTAGVSSDQTIKDFDPQLSSAGDSLMELSDSPSQKLPEPHLQISDSEFPPLPVRGSSSPGVVPTVIATPIVALASNVARTSVPIGCSPQVTYSFSWSKVVQGPQKKMSKKGNSFVLDSGERCVVIPNVVINRNKHRWDEFIIAQFQGNSPPLGVLHAIANGIWSKRVRNISVSRLTDRACLLKVPCPHTRKRILCQGMWHIEKQAMFVAKWESVLQPKVLDLTSVPVWLEFRNVPPHFFSEEGLEYIAGLVGDPLYLHESTTTMANLEVAKVFTVIDPTKSLPEAVNVQFESGQVHRIAVSCPWLPPTCPFCKEIGHTLKRCPTAPATCRPCNSKCHVSEDCPIEKNKMTPLKDNYHAKNNKTPSKKLLVVDSIDGLEGKLEVDIALQSLTQVARPSSLMQLDPVKSLDHNTLGVTSTVVKQQSQQRLNDSFPSPFLNHISSETLDSGFSSDFDDDDPVTIEQYRQVIKKRSKKLLKHQASPGGLPPQRPLLIK